MTKKWVLKNELSEEEDRVFAEYPKLARRLLFYRGIKKADDAERFFNPDYKRDIHDPFLMLDMEKAVKRILEAIKKDEKMVIFGDYDADGISGSVIIYSFFRKIGFENFHIHIPDRYKEGYGMTLEAIDEFIKQKIGLIITVDCGITDVEEVKKAKGAGIDVIICDHHLVQKNKPSAYAILDSKQPEDNYPFKLLSGAGVAFKLVQGLIKKGFAKGEQGLNIASGWEKWLLDVAAIAAVADMIPLRDENRALVYFGLKVLRKTRRVGLLALYGQLKLNQANINEDDIGFMIAPRINTASRMDHATTSFNLLTTENSGEAKWIASHLEGKNEERKQVVQVILDEIKSRFSELQPPPVIVDGSLEWMPGVLGLAANRIMEKYHCPVFLWGRANANQIKGSCRSDGTVNLVKFMEGISDLFFEFGGHAMAGGFSISEEKISGLKEKIMKAFEKTEKDESKSLSLDIDIKLSLDDVSWKTWEIIEKFAPFGIENSKPVFLFEKIWVDNVKKFGNRGIHLEISFKKSDGKIIKAIGFFMSEKSFPEASIEVGKKIDLVATMEKSTFRNILELRLRIVDIRG